MTLSKFMQNSVFVNSGAIQGKILASFYLKSTLLYDREVSYSWDKKNNELRYCLDVCVCVCVCVCVFILLHLLVSSGCTTSLTYVRSSDQRSFVVSILLASAKFLHLYFWIYLISPPKTKTPATAYWRENDMI